MTVTKYLREISLTEEIFILAHGLRGSPCTYEPVAKQNMEKEANHIIASEKQRE